MDDLISTYSFLIVFAIILQVIFLWFSFVYKESQKLAIVLKVFASLGFVFCAVFGAINVYNVNIAYQVFVWLLVAGSVFGFVGDILLGLRHIFVDDHQKFKVIFLSGSIIFFLGHVCYLVAVLMFTNNYIFIFPLGIAMMALVTWRLFKLLDAKLKYQIMGCIYLAVLFSFAFASIFCLVNSCNASFAGLRLPILTSVFLSVGGFLFGLADCLTSYKSFAKKDKYIEWVANLDLPIYYVSQMLILCSPIFLFLSI